MGPDDFVYKSIPKTQKESFSNNSAEGRATQITKAAIQGYLEQYLSDNGRYRNIIRSNLKYAVQYETRLSRNGDDNPAVYELQISRLWNELVKKLPSIMILDGTPEYINPGLGGLTSDFAIRENINGVIANLYLTIPIEVRAAASDVSTCNDLRDLLTNIFGPFTHVNRSYIIRSGDSRDKWEVRLPQTFSIGSTDRQTIEGDQKDVFWYSSVELDVAFEGAIFIAHDANPPTDADGNAILGFGPPESEDATTYRFNPSVPYSRYTDGRFIPDNRNLLNVESIRVPDIIPPYGSTRIDVRYMPESSYFKSSDPTVAIIKDIHIQPIRPGSFELQLLQYQMGKSDNDKLLRSWPVRVRS